MEHNDDEFQAWKKQILMQYNDVLYKTDVAAILSFSIPKVNAEISKGRLKTVPYNGTQITSKQWISEYMDTMREYFDPVKKRFVYSFPDSQGPRIKSDIQKKLERQKRKREAIDFSLYNSFEELLEEFDDDLSIHDIALILCQHFETIRKKLLRGELKYEKEGYVYRIKKTWFLEYLSKKNIQYDKRDQSTQTFRITRFKQVLTFCQNPRTIRELLSVTGLTTRKRLREAVIQPLMKEGYLALTIPDKPHHIEQRYITVKMLE